MFAYIYHEGQTAFWALVHYVNRFFSSFWNGFLIGWLRFNWFLAVRF